MLTDYRRIKLAEAPVYSYLCMHFESYLFFDETDVSIWEDAIPAAGIDSEVVEIWRIHIPLFVNQIEQLFKVLPSHEKDKPTLFYHEKDRHRFILGRSMLRTLLGRYLGIDPTSLNFTLGPYMKPVLKMGNEIPVHFNVSHSGDYILIAVADKPVGVDLEYYECGLNINEMAEIAFSEKEILFINNQATPHHGFFQLWTRKEALLKAASTGLNNNIRYLPCLNGKHKIPAALLKDGQHWRISNFRVDDQHIGSIAYSEDTREVRFKQVTTQTLVETC